jgi:hypothetical protein
MIPIDSFNWHHYSPIIRLILATGQQALLQDAH